LDCLRSFSSPTSCSRLERVNIAQSLTSSNRCGALRVWTTFTLFSRPWSPVPTVGTSEPRSKFHFVKPPSAPKGLISVRSFFIVPHASHHDATTPRPANPAPPPPGVRAQAPRKARRMRARMAAGFHGGARVVPQDLGRWLQDASVRGCRTGPAWLRHALRLQGASSARHRQNEWHLCQ
jgi:hypothetical protein